MRRNSKRYMRTCIYVWYTCTYIVHTCTTSTCTCVHVCICTFTTLYMASLIFHICPLSHALLAVSLPVLSCTWPVPVLRQYLRWSQRRQRTCGVWMFWSTTLWMTPGWTPTCRRGGGFWTRGSIMWSFPTWRKWERSAPSEEGGKEGDGTYKHTVQSVYSVTGLHVSLFLCTMFG